MPKGARGRPMRAYRPRDPHITSSIMRSVRPRGNRAELLLRKELWRRGLRYQLYPNDLPGRPDLVFRSARVVVFVDGDFWHGNNWGARKEKLGRGHNSQYWIAKIEANMTRDVIRSEQLRAEGWRVIRVWESEIVRDVGRVIRHIERTMRSVQSAPRQGSRTARSAILKSKTLTRRAERPFLRSLRRFNP